MGLATAGIGLLSLVKLPLLAGGLLVLGGLVAVGYEGVELDLPGRRFRHFTGLLGARFGLWLPLPAVARVVLKTHSDILVYDTDRRSAAVPNRRQRHLTLLLSVPNVAIGQVIGEFALADQTQARAAGQQLAEALQVPFVVMPDV
ncbi:hypothetical protein [Hymenobacter sp. B81]|uniref:hypothetical protein n=1 Tax=Hymenobacter sp. B81 TaxID=3344878 RepID=UPI0037DBF1E0